VVHLPTSGISPVAGSGDGTIRNLKADGGSRPLFVHTYFTGSPP
jgi:hypothetical protein